MLYLTLPPNYTPALQPYTRSGGTAVGTAISGVLVNNRGGTLYSFDTSALANGDYVMDLTNPYGRFVYRKTASDERVADEWWELDQAASVPPSVGAYTVTITVKDQSNANVQNAIVRLSRSGESFSATTGVNGQVTLAVNAATWTLSVTAAGFTGATSTLVVSANTTSTVTLSASSVTPSPAPQVTGYWVVYDRTGTAQANAVIELRTANTPSGATGQILEDDVRTATSDNTGLVQFTGLFKGVTYTVNRQGSLRKYLVTVPANAGTSVALGSIVG